MQREVPKRCGSQFRCCGSRFGSRIAKNIALFFRHLSHSHCERDSVTRFMTLSFFHQTIPPRALIHGLKPFCIWLRFCRENRDNRLQSLDPAVSMRPRNRFPRSQWDCGIEFCGLNETGELNPAVSMRLRKPMTKILNFIYIFLVVHCRSRKLFMSDPAVLMRLLDWFLRSQWDCRIGFCGLNETTESVPAVSMRPRNRIPRSQW
jgi:hypothetical protein